MLGDRVITHRYPYNAVPKMQLVLIQVFVADGEIKLSDIEHLMCGSGQRLQRVHQFLKGHTTRCLQ